MASHKNHNPPATPAARAACRRATKPAASIPSVKHLPVIKPSTDKAEDPIIEREREAVRNMFRRD